MAKVFRLHKGSNTIVDWQNSVAISSDSIQDIKDPEDGNAKKEIVSIPSPFARIDLVKTSFSQIVDNSEFDLDGKKTANKSKKTIYHKMVSDSLDVGELFFNIEKYKDQIQIIIWDKLEDLNTLINSSTAAHKALGKTLEMYFKQDSDSDALKDSKMYNFNKLKCIYLLNYIGKDKPAKMNIIGATSPSTLFFSSANNLDYVSNNISFDGQDRPFDDDYRPLYRRDIEFLKYLWAFKNSYPSFEQDFFVFNKYLDMTYKRLPFETQKILDKIDKSSINVYNPINVVSAENCVEILGHSFHMRPSQEFISSDFEVGSKIYNGKKPLILPIDSGNTYSGLTYTQSDWGQFNKAPIFDTTPWKNRTLPVVMGEYPYLTISDFLEDTIFRMPYELNPNFYFNGNLTYSGNSDITKTSYLLPLSNLFFEFFSVSELIGELNSGKKMFEMRENAGGITVTLRIPIKGKGNVKYIEYNRIYFENNSPDLGNNKGALTQVKFGMGIFPAIKFKETEKPHYRIALFDKADTSLTFYNGTLSLDAKANIIRREKDVVCSVETYVVDKCIDRVVAKIGVNKGVIIPILKSTSGAAQFTFAVDFGTTNTHIEYSKNGAPSKSFDISLEEKQMQRMHLDYLMDRGDIGYAFDDNFIPEVIGEKELYKFPIRTAFAEWNQIDYSRPIYTLASGNIPFRYEKAQTPGHNNIKTELKWSTKKKDQVKLFIENIFMLLKNKVLLNGGDLSSTKIVWFYPASMTEAQCNVFREIWQKFYKEYMGDNLSNVISMSESVAPYSFYIKKRGAKANVVTIDVGGETTDIFVVEDRDPKLLSSFRFASNAIFGDGYNWDAENNGFVKIFQNEIVESLKNNELFDLQKAFTSIQESKISGDITAFFFALSQNKQVKDKGIPSLDFLEKLSENEQLKYVFIIFYSAVIYYIARLMKANELEMPLTIAFSGNGSKTLRVLSSDKLTLAKFVKLIFEKVYGREYDKSNDLEIIYDDENPKKATCKGGILEPTAQDFESIDNIKCALLGVDSTTLTSRQPLSSIDNTNIDKIVAETERFVEFVFDLHNNNNSFFTNKFNADARIANFVKETCLKNLKEYTKHGLNCRKEEVQSWGAVENIEETLFFLPIFGMLNNLAREISKINR